MPAALSHRIDADAPEPASLPTIGHVAWIDLARVVGAVWVVTIHVSAVPAVQMTTVPRDWWWWALTYDAASSAAVPLFVMLSGAVLLTRPTLDVPRFFARRASKLLAPIVGWTLIYATWGHWRHGHPIDAAAVARFLVDGLHAPSAIHLWFLWVIAGLYLLTPLVHPFVAHATRATQLYVLALWVAATSVLPPLEQHLGIRVGLVLDPVAGMVGYYLAGAVLARWTPARLGRGALTACVAVAVLMVGATMWGTAWVSRGLPHADESFMDSPSITIVGLALAAFLVLRHIGTTAIHPGTRVAQWTSRLAALSFGVYLVHPLVLEQLTDSGLEVDPFLAHPAWYVPLLVSTGFALSCVVTSLLSAVPGLRRLVP